MAVALAGALPWPLLLAGGTAVERAHLLGWAAWNLAAMSGPGVESLRYFARTIPWFYWPAWPVALWAAWRWRGRWGEPAVALPMLTAAATSLRALASPSGAESWLLPATVPLAMLAAVGMPTLERGIVNLIDWFAVTSFALFGIVIWAYWISLMTGYPPRMAYRASQIAPGFTPEWIGVEIALGGLATLAWLALVRWRISRQPRMIWRAMVLSCGGVVLAWFLLMTLGLPVFDERNTYRDVADHVATIDFFTGVAARELELRGQHTALTDLLLRPFWRFFRFYVLRRGFMEGIAGLFVAQSAAFYVFAKYAKLWEATHSRPRLPPP